ncbi:short-chain dehydrogenase [Marinomonas piezotolerans]|uniref:Short-chain dehydrogenase n=1 Tax=Marinomonas piezotolerans TaxID=2213058 RepID=A0A370UDB9_9GAMM|nr:glucose 1-dehydrogenase [Marinomonas piezotolerans]RDL45741.1 short-chain dehydrogenase [Marinomonas piezotolerans]
MSNLVGKIAVITGGHSGIGYATAVKFKELGAKVIITGRDEESLNRAAATIGATAIKADQGNLKDIDRLATQVKDLHGTVDILFINAGIATFAPVEETTEDQFDDMMNINFKGAFFTAQKFIPLLNEGASVINLSSINAYAGMPNTATYAASKAALNALTRTLSTELAPRKIRVNSVNPGPTKTPLFGKLGMPEDTIKEFSTAMENRIPLHRFGEPSDIANLVAFLASDDASFITGGEYNIDGGTNINPVLA